MHAHAGQGTSEKGFLEPRDRSVQADAAFRRLIFYDIFNPHSRSDQDERDQALDDFKPVNDRKHPGNAQSRITAHEKRCGNCDRPCVDTVEKHSDERAAYLKKKKTRVIIQKANKVEEMMADIQRGAYLIGSNRTSPALYGLLDPGGHNE